MSNEGEEMSNESVVLVTCATGSAGNIGGVVAHTLHQKGGFQIRIGARNVEKATSLFKDTVPGATIVKLDLTDPGTFRDALSGTTHVFLGHPDSGFEALEVQQAFMDAIADVQPCPPRVVKFFGGIRPELTAPFLANAPLAAFNIRNTVATVAAFRAKHGPKSLIVVEGAGWFFSNYTSLYRDMVLAGSVQVPNGDARLPRIDARDIGEAIAACLQRWDEFAGEDIWLTGGELKRESEMVATLSSVTGKTISYADEECPAMREELAQVPLLGEHTLWDFMVQLWTVENNGQPFAPPREESLQRMTGRRYRRWEDFVRESAHHWTQ